MATKALELNADTVFSLLDIKLASMNKRVNDALDAGSDWNEWLEEGEIDLLTRLGDILSWQLQQAENEQDAFVTRAMLNEDPSIQRLRAHRHECGSRMTGGAVVVENS